jgi:hypothetical protein
MAKKPLGWQAQLILTILVVGGVLLAPTSIILLAGMIPTIVAAYTDTTREKMRCITVGAINLAGCAPFITKLWLTEHTITNALALLSDPLTWVIIYAAAGVGYVIEWSIVSVVTVFMGEKAALRIKQIEKQQNALSERWGIEVSGDIPLGEDGFPVKASQDSLHN